MDGEPDEKEEEKSIIENAEFVIDDAGIFTDDGQLMIVDKRTDDEDSDDSDDDKEMVHGRGYCCSRRCESMFDDEFKSLLKSSMSKLSISEKRIHLFTMITVDKKKPLRKKKGAKPRPCFEYVVKEYGVLRGVCKTAFVRLHGASLSMVRHMRDQVHKILPTDQRGKHGRKTTVPKETQELIKSHLFKVLESPTVSEFARKTHGQLHIRKLWEDFKQKYVTDTSNIMSQSTYTKYINSFITLEALSKFMSTQQAHKIHQKSLEILKTKNKNKFKGEVNI